MKLSSHTTSGDDYGDLLAAFAALCERAPCVYRRRGEEELLAVGVAASAEFGGADGAATLAAAQRDLQERLGELDPEARSRVRMVGWSAFDPEFEVREDDANLPSWRAFSRRALYVPSLIVERRGARTVCTDVRRPGRRTNARNHSDVGHPGHRTCDEHVGRPGHHTNPRNHWKSVIEEPPTLDRTVASQVTVSWLDEERFESGVRRVVELGEAEKVVLARRALLEADAPIPLAEVLDALADRYPTCSLFAISPDAASAYPAFVGATPERLARVEDGRVETMALAGTTREGGEAAERALRQSAKDRDEHRFVVDMILEELSPLCRDLQAADEPHLRRLANVSHLSTPISGALADGVGIAEVVDALHPTPAVCGTPRDLARDLIRELEGYDRGLYAGTFGWMGADGDGEFDVALRCGLIDKTRALAFAGAGITDASEPAAELAETRRKFEPMVEAIEAVCR